MKRLALAASVVFLAAGVSLAAQTGSVPTSEIPEVIEKKGTENILLEAMYYPIITVDNADWVSPDCTAFFDKIKKGDVPIDPNNPKFVEAATGTSFQANRMGLKEIQGLKASINILPAHRKTAKLLVFWTVRVVGQCVPWRLDERVCETFEATARYKCLANNVNTYIKINDKLMKESPCTLQIPEMNNNANEDALYDPTLTGTYVITREDFPSPTGRPEDKQLPPTVNIKIFWENKGAMRITSPAGMRNLIVNVIPYSRESNK
ncbi:MAG: hypothetical protein MUC52_01425 [Candidatus Omnitrophica bacterium]|nr:hypothetical protein [Candidatus Omnitrophota bacterium]